MENAIFKYFPLWVLCAYPDVEILSHELIIGFTVRPVYMKRTIEVMYHIFRNKFTFRPKKINHQFLRPIFSKINEAGRLYFLFFIASDQIEGFYFSPAKV